MRVVDLDDADQRLLNEDFFKAVRAIEEPTMEKIYRVYLSILTKWGMMCPHPISERVQHDRWYDCGVCDAAVICDI